MKSYFSIFFVAMSLILAGCSDSGKKTGSVSIQSAEVFQGGLATKSVHMVEGAPEISLNWNVRFSSPSSTYQMRVWLGTDKYPQQRELLKRNCATNPNGASFECGPEHSYVCALGYNYVDCRGPIAGERIYADTQFETLYFEACIYDSDIESTDKTRCDVEEIEFNTFYTDDVRLSLFGGVIPEDWKVNGVPRPACETGDSESLTGCYKSEHCYLAPSGASSRYWIDFLASGDIKTFVNEYPNDSYCSGAYIPSETSSTFSAYVPGTTYDLNADNEDEKELLVTELDVSAGDQKFFSVFNKDGVRLCFPGSDYEWQSTGVGMQFSNQDKENRSETFTFEDCLLKR
ncbi:MAG: hypothetical protein H7A01_01830 [Hahellaceae bacterium]|nr:hypothetical protein [Hahellaceae bacterium]MCP5212616.1 hypothetical protein [Hahellaceae bacterium]